LVSLPHQPAGTAGCLRSDWTDEDPREVLRTLKRGSEWYGIRKGTVQSWDRVIAHDAVGDRLRQSWGRMPPMDISDVAYDAFLVNGAREMSLEDTRPGEKIRLRIINAAASTYFHLQYAGGPMTVVAADGPEVTPTEVDRLLIAIAETYDVIVTAPAEGSSEFRATAQDVSGQTSLFIGKGHRMMAPDIPPPNLFKMHDMMDMSGMSHGEAMPGDGAHMDMSKEHISSDKPMEPPMKMEMGMKPGDSAAPGHGDMNMGTDSMKEMGQHGSMQDAGQVTLDYSMLSSPHSTKLPEANPVREIRLELTGNMERYVWAFDNRTLSEADKILIRQGENVRFILVNRTMMHHPMHLHGHFFRVVEGQGDFAPLKHTVDVPPMGTVVMEFEANEEKDWFFHCHILYHMMSGMARVVSYEGSTVDPLLEEARKDMREMTDHDWFFWGEAAAMSHMHEGEVELSNTRNGLRADWEANWEGEYEIDADYQRFLSRFLGIYAGGTFTDEDERGVVGIRYVLPLYIESDLRVDTEGDVRLELGSSLALSSRLELVWMVNTDEEWEVGAEYVLTKHLSIAGSYHSEFDGGAGLLVRF
jgi:FtsP/CotA-like multicopper oxidase with cupredoxin domain